MERILCVAAIMPQAQRSGKPRAATPRQTRATIFICHPASSLS
jgi:hypothetical protein